MLYVEISRKNLVYRKEQLPSSILQVVVSM